MHSLLDLEPWSRPRGAHRHCRRRPARRLAESGVLRLHLGRALASATLTMRRRDWVLVTRDSPPPQPRQTLGGGRGAGGGGPGGVGGGGGGGAGVTSPRRLGWAGAGVCRKVVRSCRVDERGPELSDVRDKADRIVRPAQLRHGETLTLMRLAARRRREPSDFGALRCIVHRPVADCVDQPATTRPTQLLALRRGA